MSGTNHTPEQTAAIVVAAARPVTVSIGRDHRGAGLVVAPDRVLTNAHNLRDRTTLVTFHDGSTEQGRVHAVDLARDLVVIDVPTGDLAPLEWSDAAANYGTVVHVAVLTRSGLRLTSGAVSNPTRSIRGPRGRQIDAVIEHTAPLAKGSSGSAVFDSSGRLIGLNTHRLGHGFYAAQPADESLRGVVDQLVAGTSVEPLSLGIEVAPSAVANRLRAAVGLDPRDGLLVRSVVEGGLADRAGVRDGDLIVSANGEPTATVDALHRVLSTHLAGHELTISLVRGAAELTVGITPGLDANPAAVD